MKTQLMKKTLAALTLVAWASWQPAHRPMAIVKAMVISKCMAGMTNMRRMTIEAHQGRLAFQQSSCIQPADQRTPGSTDGSHPGRNAFRCAYSR